MKCPNCKTNVPNVGKEVFCSPECVNEYLEKKKRTKGGIRK